MVKTHPSGAAEVRSRLDFPIIDADGHIIELTPVLLEYIRQVGGGDAAERYATAPVKRQFALREEQNRQSGTPTAWVWPASNTLDRATAALPRLLNQRLEEFGFDFVILYPSEGLFPPMLEDDELRPIACRAYNRFVADLYGCFPDRMTPAAAIPMHSPQEAIDELEYAVRELGLRTAVLRSFVRRDANGLESVDVLALNSPHDYDPVWEKCAELKIAPTFHSGSMWGPRRSMQNYVYSHIGILSASGEALCKALFMGGVTRRFPQLNFAFLEGGVGWACSLYADLVSHWQKRGAPAIEGLDPNNMDVEMMMQMIAEYGDGPILDKRQEIQEMFTRRQVRPSQVDDFAPCKIERVEDVRDLFVPRFYFGCEGDDPMNAHAFNRDVNPFGEPLRALFGSDIGHWDVPNMDQVMIEAYEQVERGLMPIDDFRDFTFVNAVRLHGRVNPDFYKGTRVEDSAAQVLEDG